MLFYKRIFIHQVIGAVGRKEILHLQAVDSRSVHFFDIEISMDIVQDIPDADPERFGVSEGTIVYRIHAKIGQHTPVSV
ncbi:hypothetical protein D9M69_702200 [compost metagenome]